MPAKAKRTVTKKSKAKSTGSVSKKTTRVQKKKIAAESVAPVSAVPKAANQPVVTPPTQYYAAKSKGSAAPTKKPGHVPFAIIQKKEKPLIKPDVWAPPPPQTPVSTPSAAKQERTGKASEQPSGLLNPDLHLVKTQGQKPRPLSQTLLMTVGIVVSATACYYAGGWITQYVLQTSTEANEQHKTASSGVGSFEECASAGYYVNEGDPRICQTPDGHVFKEVLIDEDRLVKENPLLFIAVPRPGESINQPASVIGKARIFDSPVVVRVLDADGSELGKTEVRVPLPVKGDFGDLIVHVSYRNPKELDGIVEIREVDGPSSHGTVHTIPVHFSR